MVSIMRLRRCEVLWARWLATRSGHGTTPTEPSKREAAALLGICVRSVDNYLDKATTLPAAGEAGFDPVPRACGFCKSRSHHRNGGDAVSTVAQRQCAKPAGQRPGCGGLHRVQAPIQQSLGQLRKIEQVKQTIAANSEETPERKSAAIAGLERMIAI